MLLFRMLMLIFPDEVDVAFIAEELGKCIDLPCHGEVVHKHTTQGIRVLLWSFEDYTSCSNATNQCFFRVNTEENLFVFSKPCPCGNMSAILFMWGWR